MSIQETLNQIQDLDECIKNGTIKVCRLRPNTKISYGGWKQYASYNEIHDPNNTDDNLGISLTGQEYHGQKILTCIDIDGDKNPQLPPHTKQQTKDLLYEIIHTTLDQQNIKYLACQSSSGGYHIYLYGLQEEPPHNSLTNLQYPHKTTKTQTEHTQMFTKAYKNIIPPNTNINPSAIELWTKKRYMVAPGSTIHDKNNNYIGTTKILPHGVQKITDIDTYTQSINTLIRQALIKNGFTETQPEYKTNTIKSDTALQPTLTQDNIQAISNFLTTYLPKIHGQKHKLTLALGGFLHRKKINPQSIQQIATTTIQNLPENFFDNNQAFIDTLLHDTIHNDETRLTTGLTTVEEILEPHISKMTVGKKLHLLTNPIYHKFWPDGTIAKEYQEIHMDFAQKYMSQTTITTTYQKDGEIKTTNKTSTRVLQCITAFEYTQDISEKTQKNPWERQIKLTFTTPTNTYTNTYENVEDMIKKYRQLPGTHTDSSKKIIEAVFREYDTLGLIKNTKGSSRTGIWPTDGTIEKYINNNNNDITKKQPQKPTQQKLKKALQLLEQISQAYPWKENKFATLIKMGLTMPYAYAMAEKYGQPHPSVILHGEAGTLKTSAGELITNLNGNFKKNITDHIVGGGELNSEYRFGRIMDKTTYPLIVNEAEHLFTKTKIRELIKESQPGTKIREPGGHNPKTYYSYRPVIYTMNTLPEAADRPEFLRRFITIEFTIDERGDTPQTIQKLQFLNTNGIINNRLQELQTIGDYIYHTIHKNPQLLEQPITQLQNHLIQELENYSQHNLNFLKTNIETQKYTDRTDQQDTQLTMILSRLRYPYKENKGYILQTPTQETQKIKTLIQNSSRYNYIDWTTENNILINAEFTRQFNRYYKDDKIRLSLRNLAISLNQLDLNLGEIKYTKTRVKGKKNQVRGVEMEFTDFCKIVANNPNIT